MNTHAHKDAAVSFLMLAASGKVKQAFQHHVGAGFRHHNPHFRGDAVSLAEAMEQSAAMHPNTSLEVLQSLQDGDQVAVFSRIHHEPGDAGMAVVHVFRFAKGHIVELWDIIQPVPAEVVNEHGMF